MTEQMSPKMAKKGNHFLLPIIDEKMLLLPRKNYYLRLKIGSVVKRSNKLNVVF